MYTCLCLDVCTCVQAPSEAGRGCWIPWSWNYRRLGVTHLGCRELNSGPVSELGVLSEAKPALQLQKQCAQSVFTSKLVLHEHRRPLDHRLWATVNSCPLPQGPSVAKVPQLGWGLNPHCPESQSAVA